MRTKTEVQRMYKEWKERADAREYNQGYFKALQDVLEIG